MISALLIDVSVGIECWRVRVEMQTQERVVLGFLPKMRAFLLVSEPYTVVRIKILL